MCKFRKSTSLPSSTHKEKQSWKFLSSILSSSRISAMCFINMSNISNLSRNRYDHVKNNFFKTSGIKLCDSLIFFRWLFSLSGCLVSFGCQSSQVLFTLFLLKSIFLWKELFNCSKKLLDNKDVPSFVRWIPSLRKRNLSIFSLHMKAKS